MASKIRRERRARSGRRVVVLPDDGCPTCGARMRPRTGTFRHPVNGEKMAVSNVSHLRCPRCGEMMFHIDQVGKIEEEAIAAYRAKHHLLSADEIRSIRQRHRLTQAQLARLLRLGSNTISRWEACRNVQTGAMDVLLRLIRDVPKSLDYLRKHAA